MSCYRRRTSPAGRDFHCRGTQGSTQRSRELQVQWGKVQKGARWSDHPGGSVSGATPKCLVDHGKSQLSMDDDWGYPHLWKPSFRRSVFSMTPWHVSMNRHRSWRWPSTKLVTRATRRWCPLEQSNIRYSMTGTDATSFIGVPPTFSTQAKKIAGPKRSRSAAVVSQRWFGGLKWGMGPSKHPRFNR